MGGPRGRLPTSGSASSRIPHDSCLWFTLLERVLYSKVLLPPIAQIRGLQRRHLSPVRNILTVILLVVKQVLHGLAFRVFCPVFFLLDLQTLILNEYLTPHILGCFFYRDYCVMSRYLLNTVSAT